MAAGAVSVQTSSVPNWFGEQNSTDTRVDLQAPWRLDILAQLKQHQQDITQLPHLENYEKTSELSSWIKSAEAKYQRPAGEFEDCQIELEWVSNTSASADSDSGTFTVLNMDGATTKIQFSLSDITCVQCCSEPGSPRIALHAPHLPANCSPVRLQFGSDAEMEDWLSHLSSVCCQINEVLGKPDNCSIWMTTELGDTFVYDASNIKSTQKDEERNC